MNYSIYCKIRPSGGCYVLESSPTQQTQTMMNREMGRDEQADSKQTNNESPIEFYIGTVQLLKID